MALIARDLMVGNPAAEMGFGEQAHGHNAIAAGFQGQRQWTDHFPNGDFMEAILNSSFDWNGIRPLHRGHRERRPQRRGHALRLAAHPRPRSSPTCAPTGARGDRNAPAAKNSTTRSSPTASCT
jgi:hypothetical protein